jgi:hypothetical protein
LQFLLSRTEVKEGANLMSTTVLAPQQAGVLIAKALVYSLSIPNGSRDGTKADDTEDGVVNPTRLMSRLTQVLSAHVIRNAAEGGVSADTNTAGWSSSHHMLLKPLFASEKEPGPESEEEETGPSNEIGVGGGAFEDVDDVVSVLLSRQATNVLSKQHGELVLMMMDCFFKVKHNFCMYFCSTHHLVIVAN